MKRPLKKIILGLAMLGTVIARAEEPAKPVPRAPTLQLSADTSYRSVYDANGGLFFSEGPVIQQVTTGCVKNTCLTLWNNYDMKIRKHNELDLTLDYTRDLQNGGKLKAGYIDIELLPVDGIHSNTQEAFLAYILPNGLDLRICRHLNQSSGVVIKGAFSKQTGPLVVSLSAGHNRHYWTFDNQGKDGQGSYAATSIGLPIKLGDKTVLTPTAFCQRATGTLENKCWGSIGITYTK